MPEPIFGGLPREVLDKSRNVIYLLNAELEIVYTNPAWDRFAQDNAGFHVAGAAVHGLNVMSVVPEPLMAFYGRLFSRFEHEHVPMGFDFECSSAGWHRRMRMDVYPQAASGGYLMVSSLRREVEHTAKAEVANRARYFSEEGVVTMCSHCRRTRRAVADPTWDWVPQYVAEQPEAVSHGLCPVCSAYFYSHTGPITPSPATFH